MSETDSIGSPRDRSELDAILRLFGERVESIELTYEVGGIFKHQKIVLREASEPFDDSPNPLEI